MTTTTVINGKLVTECSDCDGTGHRELQDAGRIEPWCTHEGRCPTCGGEGWVPLMCVYCGRGVQAVVIDHDGMPKCSESWELDHPGRHLPRAA